MLEHEFRLVVLDPEALSLFQPQKIYKIIYAKPHFRFKHKQWEYKKNISQVTVYHEGFWFRWVTSKELAFQNWTRNLHSKFIDSVGFFQNPFTFEYRIEMELDEHAKIYAYRKGKETGIVFEYETTHLDPSPLSKYKDILNAFFKNKSFPAFTLKPCIRKVVKPVKSKMSGLVALKFDGIFGFVYSYSDKIVEFWEGNVQNIKYGITLGDGIVFSAEKMGDIIVLLDVYQVRGVFSAHKESIFLDFLPHLQLPNGYQVQNYVYDETQLPTTHLKTDGLIYHNLKTDKIYKLKTKHTVDLVYWDGYFLLPDNKRVVYTKKKLENGCVYEVSLRGRVIGKRSDRFVGNSAKQWQQILSCGNQWKGPPFENRLVPKQKRSKK